MTCQRAAPSAFQADKGSNIACFGRGSSGSLGLRLRRIERAEQSYMPAIDSIKRCAHSGMMPTRTMLVLRVECSRLSFSFGDSIMFRPSA